MRSAVLLIFTLMLFAPLSLTAGKPLLSEEIRNTMETQSVEAAKERFNEIYPEQQADYEVDVQGVMNLMTGYMQAGDMEKGMALGEMLAQVSQVMVADAMSANSPQMAAMMAQQQKAEEAQTIQRKEEKQAEQRMQEQAEEQRRGKSRMDLERFSGLYGNENRYIFVTVSCDGYLVTGPMWADVGPWWMRSAADKVFSYSDSFTNLSMEFETDSAGRALRLIHDIEGANSPAARTESLPADWPECQQRPLR